jgi:agmatinase
LAVLRSFAGPNLVGADMVEVAPAYDHAQITGIAAPHVGYDRLSAPALAPALAQALIQPHCSHQPHSSRR